MGKQMLLCETICGMASHDGLLLIYQTGMQAADMFRLGKYLTNMSARYPAWLGQTWLGQIFANTVVTSKSYSSALYES